ncbi:hypothetical protein SAMN04489760_12322 [Syntrophus gentianae]|uniref:N-acetyltransferase domain-containing protein n=1 Tax=Syntrophus gentianae TaxID=43775 RepID=A0A1H7ZIM1_9BACT|nr:hypothetical protein [Syntrophus gentianae]SEM57277.1 hypothetical protein SAMN04489760_12322 [Syntrophus gentianae]
MAKETKEEKTAEKSFTISPFRNEDAEGIVDLFHTVYGEHYPIRLFYDSQAIVQANEEGRYYSIVARTMDDRVIGVEHLYRSAPGPYIYEAGVGLVDGGYRNLGVNMKLLGYLYDTFIPERKNIEEVFGEAVCNHLFMQKTVEKYRHVETAIEVSLMPAAAYDKEKSATGRVATLGVFRCYQPKPHRIYLPAPYEREIRTLYGRLDDTRDIAVSAAKVPGDRRSRAELSIFDFAQVARIAVPEVGADFGEFFSGIEKEAISRKALVIQVWVDLTQPWVGEAVKELRMMGYFFGGALPRWFDGDGFLMQKLLCPPYFESIQLFSNFSKELLEVVKKDWKRTGA